MPAISVIVPVYNVEKYLHKCIDSILTQTFTDFELILVDDESPDACGDICDEFSIKDSRVISIHQKNSGVSNARNTGLDQAKGDYIVFCDSDDYLQKDYLETLYSEIDNSNYDFIGSGYETVDEFGNANVRNNGFDYQCCFYDDNSIVCFIINNVLSRSPSWRVGAKIYKRSIIQKHSIRFCETCENYAEDLSFYLNYLLYCLRIKFIKYYGYKYVQRNDSMVHRMEGRIKLNALNEAAKNFWSYYCCRFHDNKKALRMYPIIHYLFMDKQYYRIRNKLHLINLKREIKKIDDNKFYLHNTIKTILLGKSLKALFGKNKAFDIKNFSFYCLHHSRVVFSYCDGVFYNFFA